MSTEHSPPHPSLDARDAFAELGRFAFQDTSMEAMLQRVAELAKQVVPAVVEASVTLVANDKPGTAAFTGALAQHLDESQYDRGHGPCLDAAVGQQVLEIRDARTEARWPDYARSAVAHGSLSSLSMPVPVRDPVFGALNLYGLDVGAFDDGARDTARSLASYAAVAVQNMHLYESARERAENLDKAMQTRAVIEQAKGILMAQRRCDAGQAFDLLSAASQRSNRKLREIATAIVDSVRGDGAR